MWIQSDARRVEPFAEFIIQGRRCRDVSRAAQQPTEQRSIDGTRIRR
jgi:hypothetical protein